MGRAVARTTRIWQREREWDSGPAAEKLWDNLVPGKTGIILINKPEEYGLEPGLETEVRKAGVYTLSGAHQSHCNVSATVERRSSFGQCRLIKRAEIDPGSTPECHVWEPEYLDGEWRWRR